MRWNVPPNGGPRLRGRAGLGPWLVVPAVILLLVFLYWPLVRTLDMSLRGTDLIGNPSGYVGFDNYRDLVTDPAGRQVLTVTLVLTVGSTVLTLGGALAAALPLRRSLPGGGLFRIVLSLPFAYSAASAATLFFGLLAPSVGTLNNVLKTFGVEGPGWLQSPGLAMLSVSVTTAWFEFGFAFLVLLAALQALPSEVLEAAELDGASGLRMVRSVIVPLISPSLLFLAVTGTINGLQLFTQAQVLTGGGPNGSTTTFVIELYQRAFGGGVPDYGRASAVATVLILLVVVVTGVQFLILNRRVTTS